SYVSGVEQYFTDVASDSGHQTNVYSVGTQYFDKRRDGTIRNHANYDVVAGAPIMDADPYPANACPPPTGYTNCLSDRQIELEIQRLVNSQHLAKGRNSIYFMFLPAGIDSCFGRRICADNYFCAYHSGFVANSGGIILYTNQPFANLPDGGCDASGTPNGADLDDVLNVVSHEHNETITDPLGNAWYARDGEENGDKCNFRFDNPGAQNYNQTINGHNYELQEEWSNHSRTCLPYGH
ncbi:MAG TPA: hypothetical protein VG868_05130, partial [Casimicrobiaceae bacterium]|nr:hypothetical protein [Casimicrobiaceae bacterium]